MSEQHTFDLNPETRQYFERTPGPWEYRYWEGSKSMFPYAEIGVNLDAPRPHCQYVARAGKEEDARLIAAAPELLEACQAALAYVDMARTFHQGELPPREHAPHLHAIHDQLVAAVAKATGDTAPAPEPVPLADPMHQLANLDKPLSIGETLPAAFAPTVLSQIMRERHAAGTCGWGCPECQAESK